MPNIFDRFFKPSSNVKVQEEHMREARIRQNLHFELLNGTSFDVLPKRDFNKFEIILRNYFPKNVAKNISTKFSRRTEDLTFRIVLVYCYFNDEFSLVPVIRVLENSNSVIYDSHCRRYSTWSDYLCSNKLPKCVMIFPENGHYEKKNGELNLDFQKSPSISLANQTDEAFYIVAKVVSTVSTIAPLFSFVQPYGTVIKFASGLSEGYIVGHHGYKLFDQACYDEDWLNSDEALQHWAHIGKAFFSFALTFIRVEYGQPSGENDMINFFNVIKLCQMEMFKKDPIKSIDVIKCHVLGQHMMWFNEQAVIFLQKLNSNVNSHAIMDLLRKYLGNNSVFRQLIHVEANHLEKVAKDLKSCQEVNNFHYHLYDDLKEKVIIVDRILKEVQVWENGKISDIQLQFRLTEILRGGKKYETVHEMLLYFKVGRIEDIQVKGKYIFKDIGSGKLEFVSLIDNSVKKYPQLLSYAVDYAEAAVEKIDWGGFKAYFKDRLLREISKSVVSLSLTQDISWFNAINLKEVRFLTDMPENIIDLVKPRELHSSICAEDLVNLGKKVLGSLNISMKLAYFDIDWAILISKPLKRCVLIGPKITLASSSINGSYPVFIRNLL